MNQIDIKTRRRKRMSNLDKKIKDQKVRKDMKKNNIGLNFKQVRHLWFKLIKIIHLLFNVQINISFNL